MSRIRMSHGYRMRNPKNGRRMTLRVRPSMRHSTGSTATSDEQCLSFMIGGKVWGGNSPPSWRNRLTWENRPFANFSRDLFSISTGFQSTSTNITIGIFHK